MIHILKKMFKTQEELQFMANILTNELRFFSDTADELEPKMFQALMQCLKYKQVEENQIIFNYGDKPDNYYIILTGVVSIWVPQVHTIEEIKSGKIVLSNLTKAVNSEMDRKPNKNQRFHTEPSDLSKPHEESSQINFRPNHHDYEYYNSFPEKSALQHFFLTIKQMQQGEYFGEIAIINDSTRTATIVTDSTVELIFLDKKDFAFILGEQ